MKGNMHIYYDEEGDFLEITLGDISDCYFDDSGNGIFKIVDKKTKEVKGIAISAFKKRAKGLEELELTLPVRLEISS